MVTNYDCKILYHPGKENVVVDALSHKAAGYSVGEMCMRISVDSMLFELTREAHAKGFLKEKWKQEGSWARSMILSPIVDGYDPMRSGLDSNFRWG